jgi:Mn2+/Fe2+ NRAMP family transporter
MLVAINQSIAAVCALAPKQLWNFADYRSARERPTLSYLISGACTLTITLPISFGFYLLRVHFPLDVHPILPFAAQAKWLLLPTVLSIALAFACDDAIEADHELWWLKWVESAGLAALMGLSGFLVMRWLSVNQPTVQHLLLIPSLLSASIGALFGATIPYWYRKTMRGTGLDDVTRPVLPSTDKIAPAV